MEYTAELINKAKNDVQLQEQIILNFKDLVWKHAIHYNTKTRLIELEDFVQIGYGGVLDAIQTWDCERGRSFPSWVYIRVLGSMSREYYYVAPTVNKRQGTVCKFEKSELENILRDDNDFYEDLEKKFKVETMWDCIDKYATTKQREMIYRVYKNKETLQSIAAERGVSHQSINELIRSGIANVKRCKEIRHWDDTYLQKIHELG